MVGTYTSAEWVIPDSVDHSFYVAVHNETARYIAEFVQQNIFETEN